MPHLKVEGAHSGGKFVAPPGTLVDFRAAHMTDVDFRHTRIWAFKASASVFTRCDFRAARIEAGHFGTNEQSIYLDCRFDKAQIGGTDAGFARFERCTFDGAKLDRWRAFNAEFIDCHFAGRIVEVAFAGRPDPKLQKWVQPPRSINEFRGNDFREAELIDCVFARGIDLGAQMWPRGDSYVRLDHFRERLLRARAEVAHWQDNQWREEALLMLRAYEPVAKTQDELFARRDDLKTPAEVRNRVWEILSQPLE